MLVFGHIGITAGVSKALEFVSPRMNKGNSGNQDTELTGDTSAERHKPGFNTTSRKMNPIRPDYRLVIIGSIFPDLIDKPVFLLFGGSVALSGRDYAHTLLFSLVLLAGGLLLSRKGHLWLLVLALASFMHLLLDRIWNDPVTLFWPLLGPLRGETTEGWIGDRWYSIFTVPAVYIPEIIGLVILLVLFIRLVRHKGITGFITKGIIE